MIYHIDCFSYGSEPIGMFYSEDNWDVVLIVLDALVKEGYDVELSCNKPKGVVKE